MTVCSTSSGAWPFLNINILQGSVATHLTGGGIFYYRFTTNLPLSLSVKQFCISVSIWQSWKEKYSGLVAPFSRHGVYYFLPVSSCGLSASF